MMAGARKPLLGVLMAAKPFAPSETVGMALNHRSRPNRPAAACSPHVGIVIERTSVNHSLVGVGRGPRTWRKNQLNTLGGQCSCSIRAGSNDTCRQESHPHRTLVLDDADRHC